MRYSASAPYATVPMIAGGPYDISELTRVQFVMRDGIVFKTE